MPGCVHLIKVITQYTKTFKLYATEHLTVVGANSFNYKYLRQILLQIQYHESK